MVVNAATCDGISSSLYDMYVQEYMLPMHLAHGRHFVLQER